MEQPNLLYIQKLSDGDSEFEKTLIDIVKSEFPTEKKMYYNWIQEERYIQAAESVHKLKHKISILGLEHSYEKATLFEHNLKEQNTTGMADFDAILAQITAYLKTI